MHLTERKMLRHEGDAVNFVGVLRSPRQAKALRWKTVQTSGNPFWKCTGCKTRNRQSILVDVRQVLQLASATSLDGHEYETRHAMCHPTTYPHKSSIPRQRASAQSNSWYDVSKARNTLVFVLNRVKWFCSHVSPVDVVHSHVPCWKVPPCPPHLLLAWSVFLFLCRSAGETEGLVSSRWTFSSLLVCVMVVRCTEFALPCLVAGVFLVIDLLSLADSVKSAILVETRHAGLASRRLPQTWQTRLALLMQSAEDLEDDCCQGLVLLSHWMPSWLACRGVYPLRHCSSSRGQATRTSDLQYLQLKV